MIPAELKAIEEVAQLVRASIDPGLPIRGDGKARVTGACLCSSVLTALLLSKFGSGDATIRGGDGDTDGGALDADGNLRGHYWVELEARSGRRYVVDVTADQFGFIPVVVLQLEDVEARRRYRAGNQQLVDDHVRQEREALRAVAGAATAG